jgi:hypothetical protein
MLGENGPKNGRGFPMRGKAGLEIGGDGAQVQQGRAQDSAGVFGVFLLEKCSPELDGLGSAGDRRGMVAEFTVEPRSMAAPEMRQAPAVQR